MTRIAIRVLPVVTLLVAGVSWLTPPLAGQGRSAPSTANGEWPMYTADLRGSRYSPLDQIDASNFGKLEVAWRFKTDNLGPRPETKLEGTPIMVNGRLYATGGTRRSVIALDPTTGELQWVYGMDEGERATRWAPRKLSGRGLSYWTDGKGDERILYVTIGYRLVSLDAGTGRPSPGFGADGVVDLKVGVLVNGRQADLEKAEIGLHSTPTVVNDMVIVGSAMSEGIGYDYTTNARGLVRAFDVRTGKEVWRFDTIPGPGDPGHETWEDGSAEYSGNAGVWTQITVDPEAGLVYLPVESPTIDLYGGARKGDNLYGESLVAVDLQTGKRKWHFQFVHHPIWDYDIPSAPLLIDTTVAGQPRKLVAVPSKQGWLYVFDRITGTPIWPIEERPVPQSTLPGERTSPTQPFVTRPPAYARTHIARSDLIDFTPALRAQALKNLSRFRWEETPYVPATGPESPDLLGAINIGNTSGGSNWPGGGFDPETGIVYLQAGNSAVSISHYTQEELDLVHPDRQGPRLPRWEADPDYGLKRRAGSGSEGRKVLGEGLGRLPIVKPPYGVLAAIDLDDGSLKFRVPHGDTPDPVRNSPLLKGLEIGKTGQGGMVGVLVTKTLVIAGDPQFTTPEGRARGAMLRAYDKDTGEQVAQVLLPAPVVGQPMTYAIDGRQYIVVGVSGGNHTGEYISFRLPRSATTTNGGPL